MDRVLKILYIAAILVVSTSVSGLTLMILWGWFVAPTFHTAPLRLVQAMGLAIVGTWLVHKPPAKGDGEEEDVVATMVRSITYQLVNDLLLLILGLGVKAIGGM